MAAITTRLRAELRSHWRAWATVVFLIAFGGGVVLTTAAGARRTDSAYPRFLRASHAADLLLSPDRTGMPRLYGALARATGATVTPVIGYGIAPVSAPDRPLLVAADTDGRFGFSIERPKLTAGRMLRADDPTEVVADRTAARALHLHPGSELHVRVAKSEQELPSASDVAVTLHVVGIGVTRDTVVTVNALATAPTLLAGPAFAHRFGPAYYAFDGAFVVLRPGESKSAFTATAQSMARRLPETGGNLSVADETEQAAQVEHAIRPQAVALGLFAALTALTALFAIGQVLSRRLFLAATDNDVLRALGMRRRELLAIGLAEAAVVATAGALLAIVLAVIASPAMPIGPARLAEPHPGLAFDWTVLGIGSVAIVASFVAGTVVTAWRLASRRDEPGRATEWLGGRPSPATRWATTAGTPPAVAIGVGYAVDRGRGRTGIPARGAIAVTALAVAAMAATATFGANLSRLVHTPRLYGQSWDLTVDAQFSPLPTTRIDALLRATHGVAAWTFGTHADVIIGGRIVPGVALAAGAGDQLAPTVVDGRPAGQPDEIALGTKTLHQVHRAVGETVTVTLPRPGTRPFPPRPFRIVGRSVFPFFGEGSFTPTGLGVGAQITESAFGNASGTPPVNIVLVRVGSGRDHDRAVTRVTSALGRAHLCGVYNQCTMSSTIRPTDIRNYARIQSTPLALAVVLILLALGVVANLLVTSIRGRRRDLAILKTLGFRRRQVSATVAWQATTLVVLALVIGLPVGTALGRSVWTTFATNLGIPGDATTPLRTLVLAVPIALVVANAIAAVPGILASRLLAATALRTE